MSALYRTEVLGEWCGSVVPPSPYYSRDFFNILKHYHQHGTFNVATMSIRQWTKVLMEDRVTHTAATPSSSATLLPVHAELGQPQVGWPRTWCRARMRGLPGDLGDSLFRHLHGLLPTQDRVARLGGSRGARAPGVCRRCLPDTPDSLLHTMFHCSFAAPVTAALLSCVQHLVGASSYLDILFLNFDLSPEQELPVVTLLATAFLGMWNACKDKKRLTPAQLRASLLVRCHTMCHTRKYKSEGDRLRLLVDLCV